MNVDTSINIDARVVGIGVVIQNSYGEVKATLSKKIAGLYPLKVA